MSAPDIDRKVMEGFAVLAGDEHMTIVLGAGASAPSGLPTWDEFAIRLAVRSGIVATREAAAVLLSKQDQTIVLEAAHARSGDAWPAHLNEALYGLPTVAATPSPLHLAAAGHYAGAPEATTLATLNFDVLLELALRSTGSPLVVIDTDGDDEPEAPTVHHLHGAVYNGQEYSAVVGYRDFAELVADPKAWQREFLSSALQRGPLLLAGTSYRDPDIRHWLHLIMRDEKPTFPALVTLIREGLALDRETFATIESALASEWESIGLQALAVQDLADVALVIRELKHAADPGYQPPAERARRVWDAHTKRFAELQRDYSARLATDSDAIGEALGVTTHRATLWLANARGKLARWASESGQFAAVRQLKLLPTGHDSPWIAGEAIGAEEVKLKDAERDPGVTPAWRSVLAVPVFVGDGIHPDFATAVVTFGLSQTAAAVVAREAGWRDAASELSAAWGTRLAEVAFGDHSE